ncbi:LPXTG cell wall anchor domain-containing protein [Leifsonia sp. C5G2]|nr:LPXTG cell wall anchor domain-containing protein [Leifsonia sp. C5G2]
MCGSTACWTGNADTNDNGVPRWASVVICGTAACATGHEDYDADGVSDAIQLAACVLGRGDLAKTGASIAIGLIAVIAAALIVTGLMLARKRRLFAAALDAGSAA